MLDWNLIIEQIAKAALLILYFGVVAGTVVVTILDNRNPVKTLAWILVLMFVPVVGLILYVFFGRSQRHLRIISRKGYNHLLKKPLALYMAQEPCPLPAAQSRLITLFQNINQAFPFDGNRVEAYTDGLSMLHSLLRHIAKAEHHIHMEYYIIEDDAVGRLVRDLLADKARAGVEVRLIYDDVGCWHVPRRFFEQMREEGIEVRPFLPVRFPLFTSRVNYRNHRKIAVIDGSVGFVGGMNLALRYVRGLAWGTWRDTHLRITGPAVHGLQTAFLADWAFVDSTLITAAPYFPPMERCGSSLIQIVTNQPVGQWKPIMQGLGVAIAAARRYFYIQTPYFLPTDSILKALQTAALAGVDVRLMLPERADKSLTHLASCSYIADLLSAGGKVYFYRKGFIHSKLMVADDAMFTAGSANVDFRSFELNFEVNAFVYDSEAARQMRDIFLRDQHLCRQLFLKNWKRRPWHRKARESVVRLLSPLL